MAAHAKASNLRFKVAWAIAISALLPFRGSPLEWERGDGFRFAELNLPRTGKTGFVQLTPTQTGIVFTNLLGEERSLTNSILGNGSGVAAGDVDGDGWCDLYFCNLEGRNVLYKNLGNWKFEDITTQAGVACEGQFSTGAVLADVDGDGDLDLLVNSIGGGTRLFLNDGKGHFTEKLDAGLLRKFGAMSMALGDIDGDGRLDLYVANYRTSTILDDPATRFTLKTIGGKVVVTKVNGQPVAASDLANRFTIGSSGTAREAGEPDVLYHNEGNGRFRPISFTGGAFLDEDGKPLTDPPLDWGLSVMFRDVNGDGAPDLYVCNDSDSPDRTWINDGSGRFRAIRRTSIRHTSLSSMGMDFADVNRDGYDDYIVLDMLSREHQKRQTQLEQSRPTFPPIGQFTNRPQYPRNTVFLNRGDGTYAEIAFLSGLQASDWSWSPLFLDVDLDGFEDLLIGTGFLRDVRDMDTVNQVAAIKAGQNLSSLEVLKLRRLFPRLETPNLAFRNRGDLTFEETGAAWGFNVSGISQGMALADLDNDGDLDVVINRLNASAVIMRNETIAPRVAVRLKGNADNTQGIGARIKILGGPVPQSQEVISGGRYLSGDDPMRVFAAGSASNRLTIEVTWRKGTRSLVREAHPNRIYEISESGAELVPSPKPTVANPPSAIRHPQFQDVSELIKHVHHEELYNDFERQPLLPKRLSQLGPGVAWGDLNGDGLEDLVVGSGRGGPLQVMLNNGQGGFISVQAPAWSQPAEGDQTSLLIFSAEPESTTLVVGVSDYENGAGTNNLVKVFKVWAGGIESAAGLKGLPSSLGPMALADFDGDGSLDLFVGGRVLAGRYPVPASSRLYRNERGQFKLDEENTRRLEKIGLVSGAVWSDLDGDGWPELILACEWGPVKIFRNDHGRLLPWDAPLQSINHPPSAISQLTGWWNGVTTADLDNDGRMDIIASNWGRNTKYQQYVKDELRIYFSDFDDNGTLDVVEAYFDPQMKKVVPRRDWKAVFEAMPFLREGLKSYREYSEASVQELFGERFKGAQELRANTLDSMVFLNRGDHFEPVSLPIEAQFAPAFGINVADFDGDGNEDLFLSQNFFALDLDSSRYDAGRGLLLRGDGKGGLQAVPAQESGLEVYGEQRGSAVGDYDGDGRVDLAVTQNGAATKLYHNLGAKPGLRVRLQGAAGNAKGIGTVLRLVSAGGMGPAREIHAGSGYWSQDSAVQVLSSPEPPSRIWVRWPGGKTNLFELPSGAREITLETGKLNLLR